MKKLMIGAAVAMFVAGCASEAQDASDDVEASTAELVETTQPGTVPETTEAPETTAAPTTAAPTTAAPTTVATTTTAPPKMRDLLLVSISMGDMTDAFRSDLYHLDRIDVLTADVFAGTITLSATSGYGTRGYQVEAAQDTVYLLASTLWTDDGFGDGDPVTLIYSQDGMTWTIPGDQMDAIARSQLAVSSVVV